MPRSQTFANLIERVLDLLALKPGVPFKMTLSNPNFVASLATLATDTEVAQSERAKAMLASYLCNLGYIKRVPDPTGKNPSLTRSGYYEILPLGLEFQNSVGAHRSKMKKDLIRRLAANAAKRQAKKPNPPKTLPPVSHAPVSQVAATPTLIPNMIEIKMPEGNVISAPATPENRKKVVEFFLGQK